KNVMNETLMNVRFFTRHHELEKDRVRVWLCLFDLYHRQFSKPNAEITNYRRKLYEDAGILPIDEALWTERIKLAAETSRIRIKNNSLHLSQLLPPHLRDERVTSAINNTDKVTCWVNCFKSKSKSDVTECLCKLGLSECTGHDRGLNVDQYKFDTLCPKFMQRQAVAQSWLVKKHHLILQDRAFCIGPVIFSLILEHHELGGCVLQSHVNSPRTTAYLANIIHSNNRVLRLLAFGAGDKKQEYDKYFSDLGITNTTIYPQRLVDTSPEAEYLEHVVAVFACPPNSYSGVKDPVDLACSRGGDLSVLQALTEADINEKGRGRVSEILRETAEHFEVCNV
ncbi:uncharacterized protein LOC113365412, partial [Ctenocephalides felis]|uniref:uncharacterized protein LOC113365412 n=1 Tax=Ctenocephalides felis TaxID=7515 RepID=UPI000E6E5575